MRSTKVGAVTITYWAQKGTLRFQGPIDPTTELNQQFITHKQKGEVEMAQNEYKPLNNDQICVQQMECKNHIGGRTHQITVTENQVTALHQFIRDWKKPSNPEQELITTSDQLRESLIEMREDRAIRDLKRDLMSYLNMQGLRWKSA